jgi:hypothetical protein
LLRALLLLESAYNEIDRITSAVESKLGRIQLVYESSADVVKFHDQITGVKVAGAELPGEGVKSDEYVSPQDLIDNSIKPVLLYMKNFLTFLEQKSRDNDLNREQVYEQVSQAFMLLNAANRDIDKATKAPAPGCIPVKQVAFSFGDLYEKYEHELIKPLSKFETLLSGVDDFPFDWGPADYAPILEAIIDGVGHRMKKLFQAACNDLGLNKEVLE